MIETRTITLDRLEHDQARGVTLFCATDGSAYWVHYRDMNRCLPKDSVVDVKGACCKFELVDGRWTLARVELAR